MPEPASGRAWKFGSAAIVLGITVGIYWFVEKRSRPPAPPPVTFPYSPPAEDAKN